MKNTKTVFKTVKKCQECIRKCKQQVNETVWESANILRCPSDSQGFKKKSKDKKKD